MQALAALLEDSLGDPLTPDCVVVQGRGMALWLMLELSRRHGICANTEFPFPRRFIERAFSAVLKDEAIAPEATAPERLRWLVLSELPGHLGRPEFEKLRRYVDDDPNGDRTFQLAQQIARVFDQYVTYRPELVLAWEREDDKLGPPSQSWQPILWRALVERLNGDHLARLERAFQHALLETRPGTAFPGLPTRVAVFGISGLPPLYVRVLGALARHLEVHLFISSPSPHFWADLATHRDVERALSRGKSARELNLDVANPLLASLGRLGADFQLVLLRELEALGVPLVEHDLYQPPAGPTLLKRLHVDLFELGAKPGEARPPLAPDDRSITIHACHSAMREVEVLHDQLLDAFQRDPELKPHDVVVMTPDIDAYAPLIDAVFRRDPGDPSHIPFRIADRSIRSDAPVIEAFLRLLSLVGGRATASEVLDLFTLDAVRRRFDIAPDEIEQLTQWVVASATRWAIDADHRAEHEQPPFNENTWRFGLTRLLLGYALPSDGHRIYEGVLPYDEIEGQNAALVGQLAEFCERLFEALRGLTAPRPLAAWRDDLSALSERMLHQDAHNGAQHQRIRSALAELVAAAEAASFEAEVSLPVVRRLLDEALDDSHQARGFLAHGVTFCAMVPMRSIPFQVVGLLGMSDGQFPREARGVDFDLISARAPRPGDRSRRDDDRYLFLEALLAARQRVIVSYIGQSVRDNSKKPPSVVLSELLDHLVERFSPAPPAPGDEDRRLEAFHRPLFVRHPLQAFSPRYFDGGDARLFSYAAAYCEGAQSLRSQRTEIDLLFTEPLPPPEILASGGAYQLHELVRFFNNPIAYLINRRLQVFLRDGDADVPDREPWQLDKLEEWELASTLLELELEGRSRSAYAIARAAGALPPGQPGILAFEQLTAKVAPIAQAVKERRGPERLPNVSVDLRLPGGVRLSGELGDRYSGGTVVGQYTRVRGKHVLGAWIRHLAGCAALPSGECRDTALVGRPETGDGLVTWRFRAPKEPLAILADLTELFELGQSAPLLLFPSSSLNYAHSYLRSFDAERALQEVRTVWNGNAWVNSERVPTERDDPHYLRTLGSSYELGSPPACPVAGDLGFEELATRVFQPLLTHAEWSR